MPAFYGGIRHDNRHAPDYFAIQNCDVGTVGKSDAAAVNLRVIAGEFGAWLRADDLIIQDVALAHRGLIDTDQVDQRYP